MNDGSDHHEEIPAAHLTSDKATGQSPGEILREARLAHDYSVEDLCAQTKLSPKAVRALEDNDFQSLSQPVFARGYYRQCAKVLNIDTERLMNAYSAWGGEAAPQPASSTSVDVVPQDVTPHGGRRAIGLIAVLLVVLVVIGAAFVLLPNLDLSGGNDTSADNTVTLSNDSMASDGGRTEIVSGGTDQGSNRNNATNDGAGNGGADATAGTPAMAGQAQPSRPTGGRNVNDTFGRTDENAAVEENAAADENAAPAQPAEPAASPDHLTLSFTDRSWVDVRDANGNRLLTGIYSAGDTHEFDGTPPYKITLGYAPGVKVSIGGQPVDVAAETTSNSTARLTVSARGE